MRTIKLKIEYDGTAYVGWQTQPNGPSIQQAVETALSEINSVPVSVVSSGRTDAGVHARGMVAHFQTEDNLPLSAFREGVNSRLPRDIAIVAAEEAAPDFHARYSALAKKYRYSIYQGEIRSPLASRYSWHLKRRLDLDSMSQAADGLVGLHDFAAFRSSGCDSKTTVREIYALTVKKHGSMIHIDIIGSGFLRNMVRVIVGTLVEIGNGARSPEEIQSLLHGGVRDLSGVTAPAHGLSLIKVWYDGSPDVWGGGSKRCNSCHKSLDKKS